MNQDCACLGGGSRFTVAGNPIGRFFCHCTICQKAYGKPFANVTAPLTLAFVPPQKFPRPAELPAPDRHIFYDRRVADIVDWVPKLSGYWASEAHVTRSILAGLVRRTRAA